MTHFQQQPLHSVAAYVYGAYLLCHPHVPPSIFVQRLRRLFPKHIAILPAVPRSQSPRVTTALDPRLSCGQPESRPLLDWIADCGWLENAPQLCAAASSRLG